LEALHLQHGPGALHRERRDQDHDQHREAHDRQPVPDRFLQSGRNSRVEEVEHRAQRIEERLEHQFAFRSGTGS
jgi:hypothetical protein